MSSSLIAENLFAQVDQSGNRFTILDSIIGTRKYGIQVLPQDTFMHTSMGTKTIVKTTKGWEICIQWEYISTTWNTLNNVKHSYPIQMSELAVENRK